MNNKKSTKRTLVSSVLSLVLCMAMLIGTTFAWFTDSVTSSNNKIQAGSLDVQLLMHDGKDYVDISNNTAPIFGAGSVAQNVNGETLWEPGKTQVAYLAIKNNGSLDLKYTVALDVTNVTNNLNKAMQYVITPDEKNDSITAWDSTNAKTVALGIQTVSEDVALNAGDTHYFALSVHMMEDAGNEYQGGTIDFDMTVLATQLASEYDSFDNQYDKDASADDVILAHGGVITLKENKDSEMTVAKDAVVTINLGDYTLNNSLINNGEVTVNGGTIDVEAAGLDNYGIATLTNVTMNAGSTADYANRTSGAEAETTYDNVVIDSAGGGIGATDGANVTFNNGSVAVNSASTSGRYLFYAVGEGTVITINEGEFSFSKTMNQKRAYIYAGSGATVYVNGGTFGKASTRSGYTAGILGDGDVIIKGGTFGFDPTQWVADGYKAVKNGSTWTVVEGVLVSSSDELATAISNGETKLNLADGTYRMTSVAKGKTLSISGSENAIIEVVPAGQGEANGQLDYSFDGSNVTFNGVTIKTNSQTYAGFARLSATYNNCVIQNTYNLGTGTSVFNNCEINITNEYLRVGGATTATFNGCTFNTDGRAILVFQDGTSVAQTVTVKDCTFNATAAAYTWNNIHVAAVSIDGSQGGSYNLIFEGNNVVDSDFGGLCQIKNQNNNNVLITGATASELVYKE